MPLWSRRRQESVPEPGSTGAPRSESHLAFEGTLPCAHRGCGAQTGAACVYVDRRGRQCGGGWCPEHQVVVADQPVCRRHAGTLRALTGLGEGLPDLDNRAPSLANWVAADVDAGVMAVLQASLQAGEHLGADPVRLIRGNDGGRRWERSWKALDHTGLAVKVAVEVDEADDATLLVRVGRNVILATVPPWIEHRRHGETVGPAVDAAERTQFRQVLLEAVERAVAVERERTAALNRPSPWT